MPRVFWVLLSILAVGCAASSGPRYSPLLGTERLPPPDRECWLAEQPEVLPVASELMPDLSMSDPGPGAAVLELRFDSLGTRTGADVLHTDWPDEVQARIVGAVAPSVGRRSEGGWTVLLRFVSGDSMAVEVGRSEHCPPRLLNRTELLGQLRRAGGRLANVGAGVPGTQYTVQISVQTDSLGNVVDRVVREISPDGRINEAILEVVSSIRMTPLLLNRRPSMAWASFPITINFPGPEGAEDLAVPPPRPPGPE